MTEKELTKILRQMRKVKPSRGWVLMTKKQILGDDFYHPIFSIPKISFVLVFSFFLIFATFKTKSALPGSFFYPLKKTIQSAYFSILPEREKAKAGLVLAEEKLKELEKVVQEHSVKNLPPAFKEYSQAKNQVQKEIAKVLPGTQNSLKKEIISKLSEIQEKEKRIFATLQIAPEEVSSESSDKELVAILLKELKNRIVNQEDDIIEEIEELYLAEKYNQALEKILIYLSQNGKN